VLLGLLLLSPGAALAFDSYPIGAPHDRITQRACEAAGVPRRTCQQICAAVRRVDRTESRWDPSWSPRTWLRFRANARYEPSHHFDRAPGANDASAFVAAATHVQQTVATAVVCADRRDREAAIAALGAALHAVQDLYAHSNLIDLPAASVDSVERALWDATAAPSALLRITGYDAVARDPESPSGDTYSHGEFAKDVARKNAESQVRIGAETKFERAKCMAIAASTVVLERVRAAVSEATWRALVER